MSTNAIRLTRGNDHTIELRGVVDKNDVLVPFTGGKVIFSLFDGGKLIKRKEVTDFTGMDDGDADIELTSAETLLWPSGTYYYQINIVDSATKKYALDMDNQQKFGDYLTVFDFNV